MIDQLYPPPCKKTYRDTNREDGYTICPDLSLFVRRCFGRS